MSTTPNLLLEQWPSGTPSGSVPFNEVVQVLDALVHLSVEDKDLTAPPTTVLADVGKSWIVGASATGAWAGKDGQIALCTAADTWRYLVPKEGWRADVRDEDIAYRYTGSAWVPMISDVVVPIGIACSDETTALTTGTAKATFRMPFAFTLTAVRASVTTAPTGSVLTVDINEGGVSILSTKLTIDATEKTSTTAATAAVISDASLADDAEITIDIDTVGSTVAGAGLKVWLIGTKA